MNEGKPVLIVTCKQGSEAWCEEEVGNALFKKDPQVTVVKTNYPDTLLVYSRVLSPEKAYRAVVFREYGFVENIIPISCVFKLQEEFEELIKCIEKVLGDIGEVKLRLRLRGVRGRSEALWKEVREILRAKNVKHSPESRICLFIEGFGDTVYSGLGFCQPVFKRLEK